MQEEVENRTLTLVVSGTKFTGRLLKAAISKYMAHCKEKKLQKQRSRDAPVTPHGKQTVKQIIGQNQGISNIEITDPSIKEFEKIARKCHRSRDVFFVHLFHHRLHNQSSTPYDVYFVLYDEAMPQNTLYLHVLRYSDSLSPDNICIPPEILSVYTSTCHAAVPAYKVRS